MVGGQEMGICWEKANHILVPRFCSPLAHLGATCCRSFVFRMGRNTFTTLRGRLRPSTWFLAQGHIAFQTIYLEALPWILVPGSSGHNKPAGIVATLCTSLQAHTTSRVLRHSVSLADIVSAFHRHPGCEPCLLGRDSLLDQSRRVVFIRAVGED